MGWIGGAYEVGPERCAPLVRAARRSLSPEGAIKAALPNGVIAATRSIPILGAVPDALAEGGVRIDQRLHSAVLSTELLADLLMT